VLRGTNVDPPIDGVSNPPLGIGAANAGAAASNPTTTSGDAANQRRDRPRHPTESTATNDVTCPTRKLLP
jgi:hypothetical protein